MPEIEITENSLFIRSKCGKFLIQDTVHTLKKLLKDYKENSPHRYTIDKKEYFGPRVTNAHSQIFELYFKPSNGISGKKEVLVFCELGTKDIKKITLPTGTLSELISNYEKQKYEKENMKKKNSKN
jgi:hypothetical protein